jgi:hypothetical protein
MRTTVRLPASLMAEAKQRAAESQTTLTALIEEGLRALLARECLPSTSPAAPLKLPTYGGSGVLPGVRLDDNSALLDLMDDLDGPR